MNLCTKPVHNLKGDHLHQILISCLEKAKECGFDVVPIIFDGASTKIRVANELLKLLN